MDQQIDQIDGSLDRLDRWITRILLRGRESTNNVICCPPYWIFENYKYNYAGSLRVFLYNTKGLVLVFAQIFNSLNSKGYGREIKRTFVDPMHRPFNLGTMHNFTLSSKKTVIFDKRYDSFLFRRTFYSIYSNSNIII